MNNLNGIKGVPSKALPANSGQSKGGSESSGRPRASGSNGTARKSTGQLLTRDQRWGWEKAWRQSVTSFLRDPYFFGVEFPRCSCERCRKLCLGQWFAPIPGIGRSMTTARSPSTSTTVCVARWSWCWVSNREPEGVCKKRNFGFSRAGFSGCDLGGASLWRLVGFPAPCWCLPTLLQGSFSV